MQLSATLSRHRGLPSNQVHALDQDRHGRLWLAGPAGLSRYDGHRVRCFDRRHGLDCAGLRCVAVGDDTVWIGTDLGLEALDLAGRPVRWSARLPWTYGLVECVAVSAGGVWLGTPRGLLRLTDDRTAGSLELTAHYDVGFVSDLIAVGSQGVVAACAHWGLVAVEGASLEPLVNPERSITELTSCLALGANGEILVGGMNGAWALDREGRTLARLDLGHESAEVTAIAADGHHWWVGCGRLLYQLDAENPRRPRVVSRKVLESRINQIFADSVGNVWVATDSSGACRSSCLREAIQVIDTGHGGAVYAIKPRPDGALRIGGDGFDAIVTFGPDRAVAGRRLATLPTTIWDSVPDASGEGTWLACQDGLFHAVGDAAPSRFGAGGPLLSCPCRVLLRRGEELLVGTLQGLVRLRGGVVEEILAPDGVPFGYVYTMLLDASGHLWVGTLGRGLWREEAGQLVAVSGGPLLASGNTYALARSPSGARLLVVQDERVVLCEGDGEWRLLGVEHPVAGWAALWLDERTVAIGSSDGLRILDADSGQCNCRVNALLGSEAWEFTNTRTLAVAADGRLYCGLAGGLVAVSLDVLQRFEQPPAPVFGEVTWRHVAPLPLADGGFVVPPGKWSFEVATFAGWLVDEDQVRYRFRLVGFEEDWSALGLEPVVRYSSLPPGRYVLEAQAFAPLTGFGEPVNLLRLEVTRSPWATMLVAIASSYDRIFGSAARNRELILQRDRLEAEIATRTLALGRATRQLTAALASAHEASRFKSQFLANMSHEIRTPMNAIIGFTELLLAAERDGKKAHWLRLVKTAGTNLLTLINDILDLSKIEAGKLEIRPRPASLRRIAEDAGSMVAQRAQEKGIAFDLELAPDLPVAVLVDDQRLNQVLLNLLGNAVKFTAQGSVRLTVGYAEGVARLAVTDTGKGIAADQQQRIFEAFDQGDASTTRRFGGTGLGLAISRHLVGLMGGRVELVSAVGQGSTFAVTLPLPLVPAAVVDTDAEVPAARPAQGLRVGIIGETRLAVEPWWRLVLEQGGLPVFVAAAGVVGNLTATRPDLALVALAGDARDWLEVVAALRRNPVAAQFLLLQGTCSEPVRPVAVEVVPAPGSGLEIARRAAALLRLGADPGRVWIVERGSNLAAALRAGPREWVKTSFADLEQARLAVASGSRCDLVVVDADSWGDAEPAAHRLAEISTRGRRLGVAPSLLLVGQSLGSPEVDLVVRVLTADAASPPDAWSTLFERAGSALRERHRHGAAMVQRWVDAHASEKIRRLVWDNLAHRMADQILGLVLAVLDDRLAEAGRLAHGIKSWSGSYKMAEVHEQVCVIEREVASAAADRDRLQGACFALAELLASIPPGLGPAAASATSAPARPTPDVRVLIVDDNDMNRELAVAMVESLALRADAAADGEEALQRLARQHYDLALLDLEMPQMDGWTTIRRIRADPNLARLQVVAFTADATAGQAEKCLAAGFDDYLSKPIDVERFAALVRGAAPRAT